jgi:hypothetical protein
MSTLPPAASWMAPLRSSTPPSIATSAPSSSASARFSGVEAVAMTFPAPHRLASWTASDQSLQDDCQRLAVRHAVGHLDARDRRDARALRVSAAPGEQGDDTLAVGRRADHLAAGDERQLRG